MPGLYDWDGNFLAEVPLAETICRDVFKTIHVQNFNEEPYLITAIRQDKPCGTAMVGVREFEDTFQRMLVTDDPRLLAMFNKSPAQAIPMNKIDVVRAIGAAVDSAMGLRR